MKGRLQGVAPAKSAEIALSRPWREDPGWARHRPHASAFPALVQRAGPDEDTDRKARRGRPVRSPQRSAGLYRIVGVQLARTSPLGSVGRASEVFLVKAARHSRWGTAPDRVAAAIPAMSRRGDCRDDTIVEPCSGPLAGESLAHRGCRAPEQGWQDCSPCGRHFHVIRLAARAAHFTATRNRVAER
jgi:hypothetical protein